MFWFRLLLVPTLVAAVTLAVRRWGPAVGGWLAGLPIVAGPVLVFYALEQGREFAAEAAHTTLAGLIATVAFAVAYAHAARRLRWYVCMVIGWLTFAVAIVSLHALNPGLALSLFMLVAATFIGRLSLTRVRVAVTQRAPSAWQPGTGAAAGDLAVRLVATAVLVVTLTGLAARLGSSWSGLLNAFPVLTTIVAVFSHAQRGAGAAMAFLHGYLQAIIGFGLFCVVIALGLPSLGLAWGLTGALAAQLVWHALLVSRIL
jgi:hypothetical protein